jgi:hypothetical protein
VRSEGIGEGARSESGLVEWPLYPRRSRAYRATLQRARAHHVDLSTLSTAGQEPETVPFLSLRLASSGTTSAEAGAPSIMVAILADTASAAAISAASGLRM